ncbi:MAG TPA: hypothetical protein QF644_04160 [Candidatus Poseidoniaceae archaeon]|nr:hypothetical protein [Candidatus Poseidoniaceae archaeon]
MTNEKLMVGICEQFDDGAQPHFQRLMERYNIEFIKFKSSLDIVKSLLGGEIDLAGISGLSAFNLGFSAESNISGLEITTYLPRRDPTLVIVGKNNLDHLPRKGKIFANSELIRRQLKRFRSDLKLSSKLDLKLENSTGENLIEKLEELYDGNILDGYVLERSEWNEFGKKGRRHTLGMQIENNDSRQRFIPPPLRGFSLLISRVGFPHSIFEELNDAQSMTSFRIESKLFLELDKDELLGINASIRRISTIAKSLNQEGGMISEILDEKLLNLDNNSIKAIQMVEVMIETLDENGQITYSLEKKYIPSDDEYRILTIFIEEWGKIMELKNKS